MKGFFLQPCSIILAILKAGDPSDVLNYRLISIIYYSIFLYLPHLAKLIESII